MKYNIVIIIALALTLTSQTNTAGTITDTYRSGDILTANKMNNIKDAVNDNDINTARNTTRIQTLEDTTVRETVTVVESKTPPSGEISCLSVQCPATHPILTGGGVDLAHDLAMRVILSTPEILNDSPTDVPDGIYENASISWRGCAVYIDETSDFFFTVSAICTNK